MKTEDLEVAVLKRSVKNLIIYEMSLRMSKLLNSKL